MSGHHALWISNGFAWVVLILQTIVLVEVLRQLGILRARDRDESGALFVEGEGLLRGDEAPTFALPEMRSGHTVMPQSTSGAKTLLVFITTRCQSCRSLIPGINRVARNRSNANLIVVCSTPGQDGRECADLAKIVDSSVSIVFDQHQAITRDYHVRRTPSATLLIDNVVRLHAIPNSETHLEALMDEQMSITPNVWPLNEEKNEEEIRMASVT